MWFATSEDHITVCTPRGPLTATLRPLAAKVRPQCGQRAAYGHPAATRRPSYGHLAATVRPAASPRPVYGQEQYSSSEQIRTQLKLLTFAQLCKASDALLRVAPGGTIEIASAYCSCVLVISALTLRGLCNFTERKELLGETLGETALS